MVSEGFVAHVRARTESSTGFFFPSFELLPGSVDSCCHLLHSYRFSICGIRLERINFLSESFWTGKPPAAFPGLLCNTGAFAWQDNLSLRQSRSAQQRDVPHLTHTSQRWTPEPLLSWGWNPVQGEGCQEQGEGLQPQLLPCPTAVQSGSRLQSQSCCSRWCRMDNLLFHRTARFAAFKSLCCFLWLLFFCLFVCFTSPAVVKFQQMCMQCLLRKGVLVV